MAATRSLSKPTRATAPPRSPTSEEYFEETAQRIRAYLASVRPLRDSADLPGSEPYQSGRSLIERLALSARGTEAPTLRLTAAQCADVVHFVRCSEPLERSTWWSDPKRGPSHWVGFIFVLEAVEESLRAKGGAS
jgi:hypothetical protein